MPWSAFETPSLPTIPQRRSCRRPVAIGTNDHSAVWLELVELAGFELQLIGNKSLVLSGLSEFDRPLLG